MVPITVLVYINSRALAPVQASSGAPWVRKLGYLCIQEILTTIRTFVHPFILADRKWHSLILARSPRHILSVFNLVLTTTENIITCHNALRLSPQNFAQALSSVSLWS